MVRDKKITLEMNVTDALMLWATLKEGTTYADAVKKVEREFGCGWAEEMDNLVGCTDYPRQELYNALKSII